MGGVSAREQAWGPFSVLQNPNSPSPALGCTEYPRCAVPGTSNEARQRRLHDRRTRRAFSPTCRPTPSAQPCEPPARPSESSGTGPTTPSHWPRRHALAAAFSSCILRMTQSTLSIDPFDGTTTEPPFPRVWSGCGGNHVASGQRMHDSTPPFPACNRVNSMIPLTRVATPRTLGRFPHPQSRGRASRSPGLGCGHRCQFPSLTRRIPPPKQRSWKRTVGCLRLAPPNHGPSARRLIARLTRPRPPAALPGGRCGGGVTRRTTQRQDPDLKVSFRRPACDELEVDSKWLRPSLW